MEHRATRLVLEQRLASGARPRPRALPLPPAAGCRCGALGPRLGRGRDRDEDAVGLPVAGAHVGELERHHRPVLDDGARVPLSQGDTFIQRGTIHSWEVPGDEPCLLGAVLVDAEPI